MYRSIVDYHVLQVFLTIFISFPHSPEFQLPIFPFPKCDELCKMTPEQLFWFPLGQVTVRHKYKTSRSYLFTRWRPLTAPVCLH